VQKVNAAVQAADAPGRDYVTDRAAYLGQVDGIVFGDDPSQGILRGGTFLHRDLRFSLTFPSGWAVQNSRGQVVSKAPDRNDFVLLELVSKPSGSLQRVAQSSMGEAGWRQIDGGMTEVNGLPAYVGTYQGTMQGLGPVVTRAAHVGYNDRVYVIAGLAPADDFRGVENEFNQAIRSFRPLSAAQAEDIRANRVELYTVRSGDTWDSIARRSAGAAALTPATLAIMNGSAPGQPPRAGERIKIVVAG
jgi:predicted Zn-dependent protease